jgi:hypothetical protein
MKRFVLLAGILLVLILISALDCAPYNYNSNREQIDRLQAEHEVDVLRNSLYLTQQELASTKNSLYEAQEQNRRDRKSVV